MTLPLSLPGHHSHSIHTHLKWLIFLLEIIKTAGAIFLHTRGNFPWSTFKEPLLPCTLRFLLALQSPQKSFWVWCSLLTPLQFNHMPTVKCHMWTQGSEKWQSLSTQPQPTGLPTSKAIPAGLDTDHCCLVISMRIVRTRTQRVTCFSRCSSSE